MKTRNATLLSIGAVLVASAAAVAVNTSIFSGTTALADTSASTTTTLKTSSAEPRPERTTPVTAPAGATTSVYDVPQVGTVTVARSGTTLYVTAASALSGYSYEIDKAQGGLIEVEFRSASVHYEFRAKVVDGNVVTDVSSHDFPRPGGQKGGPRPNKQPETAVSAPDGATSASYEIPQVGSVTVAQKDGTLYVTEARPLTGYDYEIERAQGTTIEVEFRSPSNHYLFTAEFSNGKVTTNIASHSAPRPGDMPPPKDGDKLGGGRHDRDHDRREGHEDDDD